MISGNWWLVPGDSNWIITGSTLDEYFPDFNSAAIRPLVKLSSEATGSVGTTVTIDK